MSKSASFKLPEGFIIPDRLDDETVQQLTKEYRSSSCIKLRDRLIESHVRLALNMAGKYMHGQRRRQDDLIGAALQGLTQAVTWAPERMTNNNITPYIVSTVKRFLTDFLQKDSIITIERRAFKKMIEENKGSISFVPYFMEVEPDESDPDNYQAGYYDDNTPAVCDDSCLEKEELIDFLAKDDKRMLIILELLLQDKSQVEIADELSLSKQYVSKLMQKLRERSQLWRIKHG